MFRKLTLQAGLVCAIAAFLPSCGGGTTGTGVSTDTRAAVIFQTSDGTPLSHFSYAVGASADTRNTDDHGVAEIDLISELPYTSIHYQSPIKGAASTYLDNAVADAQTDPIVITVITDSGIPPQLSGIGTTECASALAFWQDVANDPQKQQELDLSPDDAEQINMIGGNPALDCPQQIIAMEAIGLS